MFPIDGLMRFASRTGGTVRLYSLSCHRVVDTPNAVASAIPFGSLCPICAAGQARYHTMTQGGARQGEKAASPASGHLPACLGVPPGRGLVVRDGVDPSTSGFSDRRSTD
jgi:hypothetical protein